MSQTFPERFRSVMSEPNYDLEVALFLADTVIEPTFFNDPDYQPTKGRVPMLPELALDSEYLYKPTQKH